MNLSVHNLMAFNQQYFRPQPAVASKRETAIKAARSFQDILNEKMRVSGAEWNKNK